MSHIVILIILVGSHTQTSPIESSLYPFPRLMLGLHPSDFKDHPPLLAILWPSVVVSLWSLSFPLVVCLYPLETKGPKVPWWCVCIQVHFRLSFQFHFYLFSSNIQTTQSARAPLSLAVRLPVQSSCPVFLPQILHQLWYQSLGSSLGLVPQPKHNPKPNTNQPQRTLSL